MHTRARFKHKIQFQRLTTTSSACLAYKFKSLAMLYLYFFISEVTCTVDAVRSKF